MGSVRAIELNPNNALAHLELGTSVLVVQGRFDEGLKEVGRALALDPLSPYVNTEVGEALLLARRYGEAVEQLRKAIALDPSRNRPYNGSAARLNLQGKPAEAVEARDESLKLGRQHRSGWRVPKSARDDAKRRSLSCNATQRRPSIARIWRDLCVPRRRRAGARTSPEGVAENEPGLAEFLQAPELAAMRTDPRVRGSCGREST